MKKISLSIIIPVYNSEGWILPTLEHIAAALSRTQLDAEIIIVDDGSTDKSVEEIRSFESPTELRLIEQENAGRYIARKCGVQASKKDNILFIDSRVYVGPESLSYLEDQLATSSDQVWNGHVDIDKKGNVFARFWDAIVCIAWRRYFHKPKRTSFTIDDFDYYPKGTGFFFVPKKRLQAAMKFFEATTSDMEFSSDDTLLIRYLAERTPINLSPEFSCLYHGRSTLKTFLKHAYNRGQFFIDGFLRKGTRFFYPLLAVLALSIIALICLAVWTVPTLIALAVGALVLMFGLFFGALLFGVVMADAASLALLSVPFALVYLAGLWRGVARRLIRT